MQPKTMHPRAITMWDFSWIERRWSGAGYEDWDQALDELLERGYDAVRIDAFPHLISANADKLWTVHSCGQEGDWGAPTEVDIYVKDTLLEFVRKCHDRDILVGLSTWFKRDDDDVRMRIKTPEDMAKIWVDTLDYIDGAGLLDAIFYVDFCNEYPNPKWSPWLYGSDDKSMEELLTTERLTSWMRDSIETVRESYPDLDYTYSFSEQFDLWDDLDVSMLDVLEPHIWMAHPQISNFCEEIDFAGPDKDFQAAVRNAPAHYRTNKDRFDTILRDIITKAADWSRRTGKPVITTECWAIINYRDWPMVDWDWVKESCAVGVEAAAATGRWTAIGTSNFCGPQYHGMWRDIEWHKRMTDIIKSSPIDADLNC